MSRQTLNPVRRWILKSVPLDLLIGEWLKVRDLRWMGEALFPAQLREQAEAEAFLLREGGDLLGDRRSMHIGLVCHESEKRNVSRSERLQLLEDLREHLHRCGRHESEFEFLRPTRFRLGKLNTTPLFFVLWSPDAPLLERLLSGKSNLPMQIKQDHYTFRELLQDDAERAEGAERRDRALPTTGDERDAASSSATDTVDHAALSAEATGARHPGSRADEASVPFGGHSIHYRVVGSARGTAYRKMFIRLAGDRLFLVYISSEAKLRLDYITALIDGLASSTYPVYRLEDMLINHPPTGVRVTVLEARRDGSVETLNYGHEHLFYREGRAHVVRAQSGANLHIQRWKMRLGDRLLLLPTLVSSAEREEIEYLQGEDLSLLEGWLNLKGIGRTLELYWPDRLDKPSSTVV